VGAPWDDGSGTTGARLFGRDADFAEHFLNSDGPGGKSRRQADWQTRRQAASQPASQTDRQTEKRAAAHPHLWGGAS